VLYTRLHTSHNRTGIEWIDLIGKDPRTGILIHQNQLFGELNPGLTLPRRPVDIVLSNTVISIKDFFVERDRSVYMGYEWLNSVLAEQAFEEYTKRTSDWFFLPRIISGGRFRESFITVDVFSYYVNPI